jgi:hypothetical protein
LCVFQSADFLENIHCFKIQNRNTKLVKEISKPIVDFFKDQIRDNQQAIKELSKN